MSRCRRLSDARRAGYDPQDVAADAPGTSKRARSGGTLLVATWSLVALGVVLLAALSQRVERTPDELNYQLSGRRLSGPFQLTINLVRPPPQSARHPTNLLVALAGHLPVLTPFKQLRQGEL